MADPFDPYRDALVIETHTIWPEELPQAPPEERRRIEERLHADPAHAAQLEYVKLHAGFCRQITVTAEDLHRLQQEGAAP
jgi:hypothetical protein